MTEAALKKISSFNEQNLANTAWAFATVGRDDARLFDALAKAALMTISSFNEQELANTAWAFANVGRDDARLFDALAQAALLKVRNLNERNLASTAWAFDLANAFVTAGGADTKFFKALAHIVLHRRS